MPPGRKHRRLLLALGLVVAGLLGILLSVPVWFPWVLAPLASRANARFARYQRDGYSRFSLYGFTYTNQSISFKAQRIEGLTPTVWLAHLVTGAGRKEQPFLRISDWQVESAPSSKPGSSVYSQAESLAADFRFLQRWVPDVVLSNGIVRVEQRSARIPALTWSSGQLSAGIEMTGLTAVVTADVSHAPVCQLQINSDSLHLESAVRVSTNATGLTLQSTNRWWNNAVGLQAQFGRTDRLPEQASMHAPRFQIPPGLLQLPGYGDIRGSANAEWQHGHFDLDLNAGARPLAARTRLPPLTLELRAHGNTNRAVIDTAVLSSPWLRAALSRDIVIHSTGGLLRQPASLKLTADLSRQPWFPLSGQLKGEASLSPSAGRLPEVRFQLSGADVGTSQLKAKSFSVEGDLHWPALTIANAAATFEDGSTASVSDELELEQRRVKSGQFAFSGPLLGRWLPPGYSYEGLAVAGRFQGTVTNLSHSGHLTITNLLSPDLRPLDLALDWQGRQKKLSEAKAEISAGESSLHVEGAAAMEDGGGELRLEALTLRHKAQAVLNLAAPARVSFRGSQWTIDPLHWTGPAGDFEAQGNVAWPRSGRLEVSARRLTSDLGQDFLKSAVPAVELRALNLSAGWTNGPVKFELEASAAERSTPPSQVHTSLVPRSISGLRRAEVENPKAQGVLGEAGAGLRSAEASATQAGLRLGGKVKMTGDAKGLSVQKLEITSQDSQVASIHGFIPLTLNPVASRSLIQVQPDAPMSLNGVLQPQGLLQDKLTAWTGIRWHEPHVRLDVSGTPKEPQGQFQLQVQQIQFAHSRQPLPTLTDLQLDLRLNPRQLRIADCRFLVQDQPMTLTAEVPLSDSLWSQLKTRQPPNWEKATGHLQVAQAKLAAFANLYPDLLSPQGELEADISLLPGFKLGGHLKVEGARTRPLPTVGPIRNITVDLKFRERIIQVQSATANLGGAKVRMTGQADLGAAEWVASFVSVVARQRTPTPKSHSNPPPDAGAYRFLPPFSFSLVGTNVPLARKPEAIIRGDLDLALVRTNGAPPLISGAVHLHDSYFLSDLTALIPGKIEAPSQRAPYFSITNALLADWRLAVKVTGDRFLKVRTTLFNGEVSANLKLEGSLAEPLALGDIRINSGTVRFPFGSLEVQQGFVTLTSQNPYHPQLSVTALSTQFGYNIEMQVTGTADSPIIQFTSSPSLSSEQILLLLTAGELPQGTFSLTPQQKAQTLAMFFAREVLTQLGFDGASDQWLIIHSGEQISQTGRPTYNIEFRLSKTWSLVGEYDRFGDYNAGVKWRIYSR